jgi:hypothetical protein
MTAVAAVVAALTFTSTPSDTPRFADAHLATGVRLRCAELRAEAG